MAPLLPDKHLFQHTLAIHAHVKDDWHASWRQLDKQAIRPFARPTGPVQQSCAGILLQPTRGRAERATAQGNDFKELSEWGGQGQRNLLGPLGLNDPEILFRDPPTK